MDEKFWFEHDDECDETTGLGEPPTVDYLAAEQEFREHVRQDLHVVVAELRSWMSDWDVMRAVLDELEG